jgi:hypothetical protein
VRQGGATRSDRGSHSLNPIARCTESRRGLPDAQAFGSRERVFFAKEVEYRTPDSVFRVCCELQAAGWLEAVYRLYQADCAGADQIVKGDAGWHMGPQLASPLHVLG